MFKVYHRVKFYITVQYIILINFIVTPPTIQIITIPIDELYTGSSVSLICAFELDSRIDTGVKVRGIWRRGSEVLNNINRINITELTLIEPSHFQTILNISPLSDVLDGGQYSCQTEFTSDSFVLFTNGFHQIMLTTEGIMITKMSNNNFSLRISFLAELPPPTITITSQKDSVVGENYTLTCTVSTLEDIAENSILSGTWTDVNGHSLQQDLIIVNETTSFFMLHFTPIDTSDGGQYICNASITVPKLSIVTAFSKFYDIIIQREYHAFTKLIIPYNLMHYSSHTVPQPILNITAIQPESDVYLAGMQFNLQCSVTLSNVVDRDIGIVVSWQRNGVTLNDSARIQTLHEQHEVLMRDYNSLLRFDTLSSTADSGNYVCTSILYSIESRDYTLNSTGTTSYTITVIGK